MTLRVRTAKAADEVKQTEQDPPRTTDAERNGKMRSAMALAFGITICSMTWREPNDEAATSPCKIRCDSTLRAGLLCWNVLLSVPLTRKVLEPSSNGSLTLGTLKCYTKYVVRPSTDSERGHDLRRRAMSPIICSSPFDTIVLWCKVPVLDRCLCVVVPPIPLILTHKVSWLAKATTSMKFAASVSVAAALSVVTSVAAFTPPSKAGTSTSSSALHMVLEKPAEKKLPKIEVLKMDSDHLIHPLKEVGLVFLLRVGKRCGCCIVVRGEKRKVQTQPTRNNAARYTYIHMETTRVDEDDSFPV